MISVKYMIFITTYMFGKHNFYGSTTVGERGQIVLPAKLREELNISPGDKLLVLSGGPPGNEAVMILRANALNDMMQAMNRHFQELLEQANED
jgi:AbrB family looped-hinge helix DNA binding protein